MLKHITQFRPNKNQILVGIAVVAIVVTGVLLAAKSSTGGMLSFLHFGSSPDAVAKKSIDYLNSNVLTQGQTATLVSAVESNGVIKMSIKIGTSSYDSYATKDGQLLFPEAFNMSDAKATTATTTGTQPAPAQTATDVKKVDKTMLDVYVVSSCPFGLQMQRAMYEAVKTTPSLAQYINVKYIGAVSGNTITAMHGVEEAQEDLRQICIRDEQPTKYWDYIGCYMQKATGTMANGMPYGDTKTCQAQAGVDTAKVNACVSDPKKGLADAQKDFDSANKLNVTGSPTLVLNGATISETSFGGRSADAVRNIVCSSSTNAPAFCGTKLSTDQAATSFSVAYAGTASASSAANCAPAAN